MKVLIQGTPPMSILTPGAVGGWGDTADHYRLLNIGQLVERSEYLGSAENSNRTIKIDNRDGGMTLAIADKIGAAVTVQWIGKEFSGTIARIEIAAEIRMEIER